MCRSLIYGGSRKASQFSLSSANLIVLLIKDKEPRGDIGDKGSDMLERLHFQWTGGGKVSMGGKRDSEERTANNEGLTQSFTLRMDGLVP